MGSEVQSGFLFAGSLCAVSTTRTEESFAGGKPLGKRRAKKKMRGKSPPPSKRRVLGLLSGLLSAIFDSRVFVRFSVRARGIPICGGT
jgi:hypothetical protein